MPVVNLNDHAAAAAYLMEHDDAIALVVLDGQWPGRRTLERLAADAVNGQLAVPVQRTYPLADIPRALADFAADTRGKLAIGGMTAECSQAADTVTRVQRGTLAS
jgi:hypothetical protein